MIASGQHLYNAMFKYIYESIADNFIRDKVEEPEPGCVVYCDLTLGLMEHSGIYVGNNTIIHLTKDGVVERCTPAQFMKGTTGLNIYVGCFNQFPAGSPEVARRAIDFADKVRFRDYGLMTNNCHIFCEYCITGKENTSTFLTFLKLACEQNLAVNNWRIWDLEKYRRILERRAQQRDDMQRTLAAMKAELATLNRQIIDSQNKDHELTELRHRHLDLCPDYLPPDATWEQMDQQMEDLNAWQKQGDELERTIWASRELTDLLKEAEYALEDRATDLELALDRLK